MKIAVLDGFCVNPGDLSWDALREIGEVEVFDRTPPSEVVARAAGANLILTNKAALSADVLRQLPDLRYIGVLATGYNIVDVEAAGRQGIVVCNIPTYGTASVAQFVFALVLELCHQVAMHSEAVHQGEWTNHVDWSLCKSRLMELDGKALGVVGFGRIGQQTAKIGDAFGMRILAYDVVTIENPNFDNFQQLGLDDLLRASDIVSLHTPLFPDTREMMNARTLDLMKPAAFLINTSRGQLINEQDLADALNSGRLAAAAVDVLSAEPPPANNPLLGARNCIITPHMAWATAEARHRLMQIAFENIRAYLSGKPQNVVR